LWHTLTPFQLYLDTLGLDLPYFKGTSTTTWYSKWPKLRVPSQPYSISAVERLLLA
jgi:hypothetical protein